METQPCFIIHYRQNPYEIQLIPDSPGCIISLCWGVSWMTTVEQLMALLISRIYSGDFAAGSRLLDRSVLRRELSCNMDNLQAAISRLQKLGHVSARGKHGTFVAETPPCLFKLGILFPDSHAMHISTFIQRISEDFDFQPLAAAAFSRFSNSSLFGLRQELKNQAKQDSEALNLIKIGHFAGHVLPFEAFSSWSLSIRALQDDRPWIGFAHTFDAELPAIKDMHVICFNWGRFLGRAIEHLLKAGRKRPALIHSGRLDSRMADTWRTLLRASGLPVTEMSVVPAVASMGHILEYCFTLSGAKMNTMMDSCVISDESLVPQTLLVLQKMGLAVPRDVTIVAQNTFPLPRKQHPAHMHLMGYSVDEAMLAACRIAKSGQPGRHAAPRPIELALNESDI